MRFVDLRKVRFFGSLVARVGIFKVGRAGERQCAAWSIGVYVSLSIEFAGLFVLDHQ